MQNRSFDACYLAAKQRSPMRILRRALGAFLLALPVSFVVLSVLTMPPAVAEQLSLFDCINMGSAPGHPGKSLYICESLNGDVWLMIA